MNPGVESGRDDFFVDFDNKNLGRNKSDNYLIKKFKIIDTASFRFKTNLDSSFFDENHISKISYRPFDIRFIYYDVKPTISVNG